MLLYNGRHDWIVTEGSKEAIFFHMERGNLFCFPNRTYDPSNPIAQEYTELRSSEPYRELLKNIFELNLILN